MTSSRRTGLVLGFSYFMYFGIYGIYFPFVPIILHTNGLSDHEANLALTGNGFAACFAPLLVSYFADRHFSVKSILILLTIILVAVTPFWNYCDTLLQAFLLALISFGIMIPSISILDSYTVKHVEFFSTGNKPRGFQSFRVWGSIGFMLPGLMLLPLSFYFSIDTHLLMSAAIVIGILALIGSIALPSNKPVKARGQPTFQAIKVAIQPPLRGVFISTGIAGVGISFFYFAFSRYLQELQFSLVDIGLIVNLGVFCEVLLMPFTNFLLKKLGPKKLVLMGLASLPLRIACMIIWPNYFSIILTQILHAPLVIGLFVSIPILLGKLTTEEYRYSLLSLNTTITMGFARVLGSLLTSFLLSFAWSNQLRGIEAALLFSAIFFTVAYFILLISSEIKLSTSLG